MNITILEIEDREQWNNFLLRHPQGHLLQSYEWGELNRYLGRNVYRLGAFQDDELVGTMQLVVAQVSLPLPKLRPNWLYCSRGPTLAQPDRLVLTRLLAYAENIARQEHAVVLRVEPNIADDDSGQDAWLALYHKVGFQTNPSSVHGRRSWVLDVRPDAETLLAQFQPQWRQYVLSAGQQEVVVRSSTKESDFDVYYELLRVASERDGIELFSKAYHRELLRRFAQTNDAAILLAEQRGTPVAAKLLVRFGSWCWDMFGAASEQGHDLHVDYLLQYHCIQWAQRSGCHYFDFRTIPEVLSPVEDMWDDYEYKQGFGGFSRLHMPTQDYVYQPLIYMPWRKLTEMRYDEQRHKERQLLDGFVTQSTASQEELYSEI
ncbi:MAG TPA: peptidoglycan bridge formation glycyltransferase FemA/FemB family protein [Dictyobacter sp.]|jgi:lipid II:glycine glycyltransferase (peptidoglycan interpeptide bridge formation enzyme)|nr:peptidoglycan bridge formation glycyltransferase FemA/FemB family protein [Dictyobacter sp.]